MNISIVIPVYNEEKRIGSTLKKIISYCKKNFDKFEIIIVDDCSNDNTLDVVKNYNVKIIKNKENKGKGYVVKRGILAAKYGWVLFSDADLATPISELKKLVVVDSDIIIASRNMKNSHIKVKQPFLRHIIGRLFPFLVNLVMFLGFKDTQCGFKLFKTTVAKRIVKKQLINRFAFDVELLFIAKKLGYSVKEVPIVWVDKKGSTVNALKDSFRMFIDLFKIRINDLFGKYFRDQDF